MHGEKFGTSRSCIQSALGRPRVDTLKDSKLPNLKKLRFFYKGAPIRILFAFDPKQQGVIIVGGDKTGDNLVATFPNSKPVKISHIGDLNETGTDEGGDGKLAQG